MANSKKYDTAKKNRIQMLLVLKKLEKSLTKIALASILKVNHNTD